jgi:hypothetical protein
MLVSRNRRVDLSKLKSWLVVALATKKKRPKEAIIPLVES